jgi:hypothetical protein
MHPAGCGRQWKNGGKLSAYYNFPRPHPFSRSRANGRVSAEHKVGAGAGSPAAGDANRKGDPLEREPPFCLLISEWVEPNYCGC